MVVQGQRGKELCRTGFEYVKEKISIIDPTHNFPLPAMATEVLWGQHMLCIVR
jgi:hypothetical protein